MKKINKFIAILIAVLGVQIASAQTDVTSTYLTNADFSSQDGWSTNVSAQYKDFGNGLIGTYRANGSGSVSTVDGAHLNTEYCFGVECRWENTYASFYQETKIALTPGVYTLSYDVENTNANTTAASYNNLFNVKVGISTYTDPDNEWAKGGSSWTTHSITFVIAEESKATISLGYGTGSNNIGSANTPVLHISHLKLIYRSLDDISPENTADLTSYINNHSFETGDMTGWTSAASSDTGVKPNSNGTYTTSGVHGNYLYNTWWQGTPLTQTISNLPNGIYEFKVLVASGDGSGTTPDIYLLANGEHGDVYTISDGDNKKFHDVSLGFKVLNGQATIGVVGGNDDGSYNANGHWWYKADNFRLIFKGADLSTLQEAFKSNYENLKKLDKENIPNAFANKIKKMLEKYATVPTSKKELQTANEEIVSVVNIHPTLVASYANLNTLISKCEKIQGISTASTDVVTTYSNAISTAKTSAEAATIVADLTNAYNTLETARRTYMQKAYPTSGNTLDFTYLVENADWEKNSGYYTAGGIIHEEKYSDNLWKGEVMSDNISGLANGMYKVEVYLSASAAEWSFTSQITDGDENTCITVNDISVPVGVYKRKGVDMPTVVTLNNVMVKDGTMDFRITNTVEGANWIIVAHKSVIMTGKIDNTALQSRLTTLLEEANSIKDADMNSEISNTLNSAIKDSNANSEDPDALNNMIENLESSIAAANTSIADYAKLKNYIAMTAVFTDVTTYQEQYKNGEYTSDNVEPVRQELNVMRFNTASSVFKNKVEVTGWTGDLANGVRNDQHWSSTQIDYYDANSWTDKYVGLKHTLSTNKTLPKGTYVLKAAGRSSADATLSLTIKDGDKTIENVEYTGKGDTGFGIDKNGNANFSEEGQYANDNKGRGWEWEFAKFELTKETEVTLHVEVDYNNIKERFGSFSDITLWMDAATYVTVYGEALVQPLADANALVNTLPMGQQENTALVNAIALGEGTITGPDELNAAVDALKEAVKNANDWRSTYYTEKDKLVAALERFEADYNDAQNGALNYMCKSRWSTAIDKAQAAAVAKDNQTSYEVLTTATNGLIAALDAATVSVNEYAALESAIDEANALETNHANIGDGPFQRADVQGMADDEKKVYADAEKDGSEVISVTDNLKAAVADAATLNAPKEGQRFYIKVATEGHPKLGNAVLAVLGATGGNNPTGYGLNCNNPVKGYLNQAFTFTKSEGNKYYISIERPEGSVYMTTGEANGSAAGWNKSQIQATTDADKKAEFEIVSGSVDGVYMIRNLTTNTFIDCQDGGAIYTDDGITNEAFNLVLAEEHAVTLNISDARWSTLILPFDAEVPENVIAYSFEGVNDGVLTFNGANTIKANTPYLVNGKQGNYPFAGYGLADKDTYTIGEFQTAGQFTGTYVDYHTKAGENTWVLQKDKNTGAVAFFIVGESAQPKVKANRCYITFDKGTSNARMLRLGFGDDDTTGIDNMLFPTDNSGVTIYDTMGRKVTSMKKGNLYIMNGRKVVVK